jgi:hypothetical protein
MLTHGNKLQNDPYILPKGHLTYCIALPVTLVVVGITANDKSILPKGCLAQSIAFPTDIDCDRYKYHMGMRHNLSKVTLPC